MRPDAVLINLCRGGIVDEDALYERLKSGKLPAAAFDVFEIEPAINDKLINLPNMLSSPHIGAATDEARITMGMAAIEGLTENALVRPARRSKRVKHSVVRFEESNLTLPPGYGRHARGYRRAGDGRSSDRTVRRAHGAPDRPARTGRLARNKRDRIREESVRARWQLDFMLDARAYGSCAAITRWCSRAARIRCAR